MISIYINRKISMSSILIDLFEKSLNEKIGYISNFDYFGDKNSDFHVKLSYFDLGFKSNISFFYNYSLRNNLYYEKNLALSKINLMKQISSIYNTDTVSNLPFRSDVLNLQSNNYDFYTQNDELFMFNSNKELFYIQDEPYPYEKLKMPKYTEEELEKINVGIIPIYQKKILEENLISEINRYYDNETNKMLDERKTKDIIISKEEVPEVDLLSKDEYELLLFFKKHKSIDIDYANYIASTGKLSNRSVSKILNLAQNITY